MSETKDNIIEVTDLLGTHKYLTSNERIKDGDIYYCGERDDINGCPNSDLIKSNDIKVVATDEPDNGWGLPTIEEYKKLKDNMGETKDSEFEIEGFLDARREVAEKLHFFEEVWPETIRRHVMATYKKEFVKVYHLSSLNWSSQEEKFLLKWKKRTMPLSDGEYESRFESYIKTENNA